MNTRVHNAPTNTHTNLLTNLTNPFAPATASALASDNLNFQARLAGAGGAIVADGYYNIQFKLYSASSGGSALWTETLAYNTGSGTCSGPLGANDCRVRVVNGYVSVYLGSVTSFPSTIPWDQQLYLTMNVGGTATAGSYPTMGDGEMTPRLKLTAVPYAMEAKKASQLTTSNGALLSTLSITAPTVGNQTFVIQDQGAAGTYNLLTTPTGTDGYIKLQTNTPGNQQTGNFNISGAGIGNVLQATTSLQAPLIDTATATALNIGTTNATVINLNQNTTLAAGKSITITGGAYGTRPASPTAGMLYYDTTSNQLLQYNGTKWVSDRSTSTKIVAASNASQTLKDGADYVVSGNAEDEINAALTAAAGGKVYLTEGTYTVGASISIPNNTTLAGSGAGTIITIPNSFNADIDIITNTDQATGTGVVIRDLKVNGNKSNQASGYDWGIIMDTVGTGSGASATQGAIVRDVQIENVSGTGLGLYSSNNGSISGLVVRHAQDFGVNVAGNNNEITNSAVYDSGSSGIKLTSADNNSITNTLVQSNQLFGIDIGSYSDGNTISGNTVKGNVYGIRVSATNNTVVGNTVRDSSGSYSIYAQMVTGAVISDNTIINSGGATTNDAIYLDESDNVVITGNTITDTSASTTNYAINIFNNTSDKNYLADNMFSSTSGTSTINDAGTGTVYANQPMAENGMNLLNRSLNSTTAFSIQGTNKVNVLNVDTTNGEIELGSSALAGKLVISDGSSNTVTISVGALAGDYTLGIPTMTANDTLCLVTAANCANGTMFIQNQNAAQQTATYWISGTARADTSVLTPLLDTATAVALNIGTTNATVINLNQNTTLAAGKSITFAAGAGNFDQSLSTGTFKTGSGAVSLSGDTTVATGKNFTVTSGTTSLTGATNVNTTGSATTTIGNASATNTIAGTTGITGATNINTTGTAATTIGNVTAATTVAINGGTGASAIALAAGANGTITVGSQTAANTVNIGTVGTAAFSSTVSIGTSTGAAQTVSIGSSNTTSTTTITAGSGNINLNAATIATNAATLGLFNTNAATVTMLQAGTSISVGATTGTFTVRNANTTLGNAAGSGTFTNNGSTKNTTLALGDLAAGAIGTAAATVNVYTSFTIAPAASGRTYTIPAPTDSAAGRTIYISNIHASSTFIIGSTTFNAHSTATLVYDGTSWNFAGMDGGSNNYIQNQSAADQSASFRVSGTGTLGGLLTANAGLTVVGATSINGSGTASTSIGVGSTGTVTIGNGSTGAIAIQSGTSIGLTAPTTITGNTSINTTGTATTTIGSATGGAVSITANAASSFTTNTGLLTLQGAGGVSVLTPNAVTSSAITIQTGNSTAGTAASVGIDTGTSTAGSGTINIGTTNAGTINIATNAVAHTVAIGTGAAAQTVTIGSLNTTSTTTIQAGSGGINIGSATAVKTIQGTAQTAGNTDGTQLTIKGSAGNGSGNGGALLISGGDAGATGVMGLVNLNPTAFTSSGSTQTFAANGSVTGVDTNSSMAVTSSAAGVTVTVPMPVAANRIVGRILYVTAVNGTNDFNLALANTSGVPASYTSISMKQNSTATLIWNGYAWTAAGASSSTDLQSAYNNTLTSAGGAELVLNASGGAADGLTIRNNSTAPISGGILEIQTAIGTNLFSVNNYGTELTANGGAETSATFATNWTADPAGGTISRNVTVGQYVTGQAGAQVVTTTTANTGIRNNLSGNPVNTIGAKYQVSFSAKSSLSGTTIDAVYSRDGGTALTACTDYGTGVAYATLSNAVWTKVTCTITIDSATAVTNPDLIIRKTDGTTAPTIYIDNLSFIRNDTTTQPSNVQIGGGITGGQVTLFTLDRSSSPPVANGDSTYYGSMYYDTTTGRIQCYESDGWGACGSAPDNIVILTPEYSNAVLAAPGTLGGTPTATGVGTMTADFCSNQSGVLQVNTSFCASGLSRNYYRWTSPQASAQTYSIYVSYKLPSTFKQFYDTDTVKLTALKDHATNAGAALSVFKSTGGSVAQCGSTTTITTATSTWVATSLTGNEMSCGFVGGDTILFKIDVTAQSNSSVYVENLEFRYTNV